MDKRTRVLNALNKQPVDHVPVGFWIHFFDENTEFMTGQPCIDAHIDYYTKLDLDFVKIMSDGYFPFPTEGEVKTIDDLLKIKPLDRNHPWITGQLERARVLVDKFGKDMCMFYNIFNPFTSLKTAISDELAMEFARNNKNELKKVLDAVAQSSALLAELIITECGCDGIYYCVQNAEYTRFTEEEYKDIIVPSELYVLEHINRYSENNIMHCCGFWGEPNRISLWYDYPVKCVNWATHVEDIPLHEGRFLFGNKTILGGFDTHWAVESTAEQRGVLYHGTKEELQEYTRQLILNTGKLGVMIGGDCTMDHRMDLNRVNWIIEAARSI